MKDKLARISLLRRLVLTDGGNFLGLKYICSINLWLVITLSEYVKKKNGVPIGNSNSLRNNLQRSLGAKNFPSFWNFWNPIFGYYLSTRIFKPVNKIFPTAISVIVTFIFCGLIHDIVTTVLRGHLSLFFTVWFLIMGITVAVFKKVTYDLSNRSWILRASTNILIIGICLALTVYLNSIFKYY